MVKLFIYANRDAIGQTIALGAIPAHTNPYTAALYDGTLLGGYMRDLDQQGKFQHIGRLTKDDASNITLAASPILLPFMRFENPRMRMLQMPRDSEKSLGGTNVTANLLKWLKKDSNESFIPVTSLSKSRIPYPHQQLMKLWESEGVDLSKFSLDDLTKAMEKRYAELGKDVPERYIFEMPTYDKVHGNVRKLEDNVGDVLVGEMELKPNFYKTAYNIENVGRSETAPEQIRGTYERLLNAAINLSKSEKTEGVVSGRILLSAPKTYHILQKNRSRQKIGNGGVHQNVFSLPVEQLTDNEGIANSMLELVRSKTPMMLIDAPVYRLSEPTFQLPAKSILFRPSIIDENGVMHHDWNNPDLYSYNNYNDKLSNLT